MRESLCMDHQNGINSGMQTNHSLDHHFDNSDVACLQAGMLIGRARLNLAKSCNGTACLVNYLVWVQSTSCKLFLVQLNILGRAF